MPVLGTPFDFTEGASLGAAIDGVGGNPPGVDNCLVRDAEGAEDLPLVGRLSEAESGRVMEVFGSQPCAQ
ncbi:unnamed protein product, partial [Ectocarpus sp. 8 AP-2014]